MAESKWRAIAKSIIPRPIRRALRAVLHYGQRLGRWFIILWQVRGVSWADEWTLLRSALASPVLSMRSLLEWQDPILLADAEVNVPGIGKFVLRKWSDDLWHVLPWREKAIFDVIRATLKPGGFFIDAGANIGIYSVLASRIVGPEGCVISVEMMPDTAARLETHVRINGLSNVTIVREALSDVSNQTAVATVESGKYGKASIADRDDAFMHKISVMTTTIDDVANGLGRVQLMKMDLEGVELKALQGGSGLLSRLEKLIYERWGAGHSARNPVDELLETAGFDLSEIDGNNRLASKQIKDD